MTIDLREYFWEFEDVIRSEGALTETRDSLIAFRDADDLARELDELLLITRQASILAMTRVERMQKVLFAYTKWRSGDWGEEQFREELAKYRSGLRHLSHPSA